MIDTMGFAIRTKTLSQRSRYFPLQALWLSIP
ncbi:hypothetical protein AB7M26_000728 [Pseudomonas sp. F-14 TE3482]